MPRTLRPCGLSTSDRSWRSFNTIAVLLRETRNPIKMDSPIGRPSLFIRKRVAKVVSMTCKVPPNKTVFLNCKSCPSENSIPIVKSRSIMPISANNSTSWVASISPRPLGPASTPVISSPTTPGILSF